MMWLIFPAVHYLITKYIFVIIINSWLQGILVSSKFLWTVWRYWGKNNWHWWHQVPQHWGAEELRAAGDPLWGSPVLPGCGESAGLSWDKTRRALGANHTELFFVCLQKLFFVCLLWISTEPALVMLCSHLVLLSTDTTLWPCMQLYNVQYLHIHIFPFHADMQSRCRLVQFHSHKCGVSWRWFCKLQGQWNAPQFTLRSFGLDSSINVSFISIF